MCSLEGMLIRQGVLDMIKAGPDVSHLALLSEIPQLWVTNKYLCSQLRRLGSPRSKSRKGDGANQQSWKGVEPTNRVHPFARSHCYPLYSILLRGPLLNNVTLRSLQIH